MTKEQFILELMEKLSPLPIETFEESITFYTEMIDDRIEDGMSEADAVKDIGDINDIATQILANAPIVTLVKQKIKPKKRMGAWNIILLIIGSPIWLSLLIAAFAVIFSLWISCWAIVISLWAAFVSVAVSAFGGTIAGIVFMIIGQSFPGGILLSLSIFCAGLAIFFFYGCKAATKGIAVLTKKVILSFKKRFIKNHFIKKEGL